MNLMKKFYKSPALDSYKLKGKEQNIRWGGEYIEVWSSNNSSKQGGTIMLSHFKQICERTKHVLNDDKGQGLVEYALILVLIAVVVIAAVTTLGKNTNAVFSNVASSVK